MREAVRFVGNIKSATVSRVADRWFVSLAVRPGAGGGGGGAMVLRIMPVT
jgi:hypothetical protein